MLRKIPARQTPSKVSDVKCDNTVSCPDGSTCCRLKSGQWGCCPSPNAVCCSDGVHCCPQGTTCDVSAGTCNPAAQKTMSLIKKIASKATDVKCDNTVSCPDGSTCCRLKSGQWGCCPSPNAVCCSDGVHCCPHGTTCDVSAGTCNPAAQKTMSLIKKIASKATDVKCDNTVSCPDGSTCCRLKSGDWGCCPSPNAVCCSDGVHCCPHGTTCDVSAGTCNPAIGNSLPMLRKIPARQTPSKLSDVKCNNTVSCPDGSTCCRMKSGQWGCCPYANAVCCSDGESCCPHGTTCDVSAGKCLHGVEKSLPFLRKLTTKKHPGKMMGVKCNDSVSCPDGSTCCRLKNGQWGCCPSLNAVCCSDGVHCCPQGTTCDVSAGTCNPTTGKSLPMLRKVAAKPNLGSLCPGGKGSCPENRTCCSLKNGSMGCCPFQKGICCGDHLHCCPFGYTCDLIDGTCRRGRRHVSVQKKLSSLKVNARTKGGLVFKDIICPGGKYMCEDTQTCCMMTDGYYGCCPLPNATCCADHVHCCPHGYVCDTSQGTCLQRSHSRPAMAIGPTRSNVICPDHMSECPAGQTCCPVASGSYGCCPAPNAVCCDDGLHCCPHGTVCAAGSCKPKEKRPAALSKALARPKTTDVVCPGGEYICPDGSTCCAMADGSWGCCPYSQAVCCSDKVHCCPNGYICDAKAAACLKPGWANRAVAMPSWILDMKLVRKAKAAKP